MGRVTADVKLADEVWIATALLHRERPAATDFTVKEIEARVRREQLGGDRAGVRPHIYLHCVANRPPGPARYRMLFDTGESRRRLFRAGDPYHPKREGGKVLPDRDDVPAKYRPLLDWYEREWTPASAGDPLLALAARYRDLWKTVEPDEYVRELREGFE